MKKGPKSRIGSTKIIKHTTGYASAAEKEVRL